MDTQTQIDRLIELAIIQRSELKQLVEQLPQLRDHLNAEVEKVFDETEPQLRAELEEWTTKQTADKTAALGVALEAKIAELSKNLEISTQARYNAIIAEREENARLAAQAEAKIAEHAANLPSAVKDIVSAELARFPRAGEIDQLRKEFAEPRGLNPRGKWQASETYNRLDLVTYNGDSFVSNIDGNTEKPSRNAANWTLNAARGAYGGGGGITSLNDVLNAPTSGQIIGSQNGQYVPKTLVAGANITINETASSITIIGDEGLISLNDGTAASPALFFTNDTDTGIYRPAANTLGISVSGTQVAYFDENGLTVPSAGVVAGGSIHAGNGNANNPSLSFDGDQDTGFFRHQANEIGIALGGTQYATLTSTTFSITPVVTMASSLRVNGTTDSSNKDTGAIVTEGGLGVEKSATIGGNLTVTGTSALGDATGGVFYQASLNSNNQGTGVRLLNNNASSRNWYIGSQNNVGNAVEITPSTANNGTTFSTPVWQISSAGNVTQTGNLTVSGTGTSSFAGSVSIAKVLPTDFGVLSVYNDLGSSASKVEVGVSGSGRGGTYFGQSEANSSIIFSNGTSSNGLLIGSFNAKQVVIGTNNTAAISINGTTQATTLSGNLTVSGTGTSSFGGKIQSSAATATGYNQLYDTTGITTGRGAFAITSTGAGLALGIEASVGGTSFTGSTAYASYFGTTTATPIHFVTNAAISATLTSGGNLLIGTTTDGGQKLQVSGTAYVSGDATFASAVTINGKATFSYSGSNGPVINRTDGSGYLILNKSNGVNGVQLSANGAGELNFYTGDGVTYAGKISSSSASFVGAIAIGNTVQTAAAVASTHKVTISIGGTTYYLLATNV